MAWNAGRFLVLEGASVTIEFSWQGNYKGVQFAQARPALNLGPFFPLINAERTVITTNHGVTARPGAGDTEWAYRVTVENPDSGFAVFFDLSGGEVAPHA